MTDKILQIKASSFCKTRNMHILDILERSKHEFYNFKGATKLHFMRYLYLVIILFITGSSKYTFSTYSVGKQAFFVFTCFLHFLIVLCLEFHVTFMYLITFV